MSRLSVISALLAAGLAFLTPGCSRDQPPVAAPLSSPPLEPSAPPVAPLRAPDVPYEPSPATVVTQMLELAEVQPTDVVYDLGCGDGRIVIAAVKQFGARGVGIDIDPERIRESRDNASAAGVTGRITFLNQDLFGADIREATVVTLFLWPEVNLRLRPKLLRELKPGSRIVSYWHDMGDWKPDRVVSARVDGESQPIYLWFVPDQRSPNR